MAWMLPCCGGPIRVTFGSIRAGRWARAGSLSPPMSTSQPSADPVDLSPAALDALDEATRAISAELDLDRVLQLIVDRARELVGARYAALGVLDETGEGIAQFITSGMSAEQRRRIGDLPRGRGILGLLIREGRSIRIPDITTDPRRSGFPPHHPVMRSFLGVPVPVKGRPIGNFYLTDKESAAEFSLADQRLVERFALHAGIAIENARLHEQVRRLAVVMERDRIEKDLHDGIIQRLYATSLSLEDVPELVRVEPAEAASRVERAIDALHDTIAELRAFIHGLRSFDEAGDDLASRLAGLVGEFRRTTLIDAELETTGALPPLEPEAAHHLLQIAREALSNVARHSGAIRARVELHADREIRLVVADDGRGFEPLAEHDPARRGLRNIAERATALGGTAEIESAPGSGTRIIVAVPIPAPPASDR